MASTQTNSTSTAPNLSLVSAYYNTLLLSCIVLIILSIVTVIGNGLLLIATWKDPFHNLKTPMSNFVFSLGTANLLIGLVLEPMIFYQKLTIYQRRIAISKHKPFIAVGAVVWSLSTVLLNASFITVLVLTWCQVVAIAWPYKYKVSLTTTKSKICVCGIWSYVTLNALFHITGAISRKTAYQIDLYLNTTVVILALLLGYVALHKAYRMHLKSQSRRQSRASVATSTWLNQASKSDRVEGKRMSQCNNTSRTRSSEGNMTQSRVSDEKMIQSRASDTHFARRLEASGDKCRHSRTSNICNVRHSQAIEDNNTRHSEAIEATIINSGASYAREIEDGRTSQNDYTWYSLAYKGSSMIDRPAANDKNFRTTRHSQENDDRSDRYLEDVRSPGLNQGNNDTKQCKNESTSHSRANIDESTICNTPSEDRGKRHSRVLEKANNRSFTILILLLAVFVILCSSPITIIGYFRLHWLPTHLKYYNYYVIASLICNDVILFKFALDPIAYAIRLPKYRKAFRNILQPSNKGREVELRQHSRRQSDGSKLQRNDNIFDKAM